MQTIAESGMRSPSNSQAAPRGPRRAWVLCGIVLAAGTAAYVPPAVAQQKQPAAERQEQPPPKPGTLVIRGCVSNGTFTNVSTTSADPDGRIVPGATYRLAGPRRLLNPLRSEHNGHHEEVTGVVRGTFAPTPTTGSRDMGGVSVQVGVVGRDPRANTPHVPEMPSIEVRAVKHLDEKCP